MRPKVNRSLMTGVCWAPQRFTRMADVFIARWTFCWGPTWDWKRSTYGYVEAQHQVANARLKVHGDHVTGGCWAPRAVHRDRWLHRTLLSQLGAHMDSIEAASKPESFWFWHCSIELCAGAQEYTFLDGNKRNGNKRFKVSSRLRAVGSFRSSTAAPHVPLWQLLNYNMDLYCM